MVRRSTRTTAAGGSADDTEGSWSSASVGVCPYHRHASNTPATTMATNNQFFFPSYPHPSQASGPESKPLRVPDTGRILQGLNDRVTPVSFQNRKRTQSGQRRKNSQRTGGGRNHRPGPKNCCEKWGGGRHNQEKLGCKIGQWQSDRRFGGDYCREKVAPIRRRECCISEAPTVAR